MSVKIYVGALTDKLYAFKNRCWELSISNTIDIYDSLGSNIKVYVYGSEVKRVLPLKNDFINEEWISNKTRYFFEGLVKWRINIPLMRKLNVMIYVSWVQAFYFFLIKIWFYSFFYKSKNLILLNSMFVDYELIVTSKILIKKLGFLSFNKKTNLNINDYYLYYLNPSFSEDIFNKKIFIFVGYNLRLESPILNIKLRKKNLKDEIFNFIIGSNFNDNLNFKIIGLNVNIFIKYLQGKLKNCILVLKKIKKIENNFIDLQNFLSYNMFLLGNNIINRLDNKNIIDIINKYNKFNNIINLNYNNKFKKFISNFFINFSKTNLDYMFEKKNISVNTNILYLRLTSLLYEEFNMYKNVHNIEKIKKNDILYLLGTDNLNLKKVNFLIFQGHHINLNNINIDLIFPSITFFEKSSNFLNIEGNFLQTNFILYPPVFCRNDWGILNALYIYIINFINKIYNINIEKINFLKVNRFFLPINNFKKINFYLKNLSTHFYFKEISKFNNYFYNNYIVINKTASQIKKIYNSIISNIYYNPYNLDIICETGSILQACSINFDNLIQNYQNIKEKKVNSKLWLQKKILNKIL